MNNASDRALQRAGLHVTPAPPTIVQIFENAVRDYPDRPAALDDFRTLTYRQLNDEVNALASTLLEQLGEGPELVVFILGQRVNTIQAAWAILKCGKGHVGLDPKTAVEKQREILLDTDTRVLITDDQQLGIARQIVEGTTVQIINLDSLTPASNIFYSAAINIVPEAPAAVLYTSGSTGRPKGLVRTFRMMQMRQASLPEYRETDRVLLPGPLMFAQNHFTMFSTARVGACLCMFDLENTAQLGLAEWVKKRQVTVMTITPSLFRIAFGSAKEDVYPSLRSVRFGGEAATRQELDIFKRCTLPGTEGGLVYASTELGMISQFHFDHSTEIESNVLPIGKVVAGRHVFILNEDGHEVPHGEVGEIVVGAATLGAQYWKNAEIALEKIKPDPADSTRSLYFTGDLGCFRMDGMLEHRGRKDSMVKINGRRIELREFEAVLVEHSGVQNAAVLALPMKYNPSRISLAMFYVPKAKTDQVESQDLRDYLYARFPNMRLPMRFIPVEYIPITERGKTDYKQLAATLPADDEIRPILLPSSEMEQRLLVIWQKVLAKDTISVEDNFFELGGDSLLAMQLLLEIEKELGRRLPLTVISRASNIREQAQLLLNKGVMDFSSVLIPIRTAGTKEPIFCIGGRGGDPIKFNHLLRYLPKDRPVYFFRSRGLQPDEALPLTVEEIAADYLYELRKIQPQGPFYFVGESGGGMVAYEMAQQLRTSGAHIGLVMMLDTYFQEIKSGLLRNLEKNPFILLRKHVQILTQGSLREYFKYYRELRVFRSHEKNERKNRLLVQKLSGDMKAYERVEAANMHAARLYDPKPLDEQVVLIRAKRQMNFDGGLLDHGWGRVGSKKLIVFPVDCFHGNILFEPFVQQVAEEINRYLG